MPPNKYSKAREAILRGILEKASEKAGEETRFVQRKSKMMEKKFVEILVLAVWNSQLPH